MEAERELVVDSGENGDKTSTEPISISLIDYEENTSYEETVD